MLRAFCTARASPVLWPLAGPGLVSVPEALSAMALDLVVLMKRGTLAVHTRALGWWEGMEWSHEAGGREQPLDGVDVRQRGPNLPYRLAHALCIRQALLQRRAAGAARTELPDPIADSAADLDLIIGARVIVQQVFGAVIDVLVVAVALAFQLDERAGAGKTERRRLACTLAHGLVHHSVRRPAAGSRSRVRLCRGGKVEYDEQLGE